MSPRLTFVLGGPGQERLIVDSDGTARYLILDAAHPDWADRAGLFRTGLTEDEVDRVTAVAHALLETAPAPRGRTGPVVTASAGRRSVTHPLTDPAGPAATLLSDLVDRVRAHPVAVVSLAAEVVNADDVRLRFDSVGTDAVAVRLARDSCRVEIATDGVWSSQWASTPSTRLALVAGDAGFLDGVNSPATLDPGMTARTMLPGALAGATGTPDQLGVRIAGWLGVPDLVPEEDADDPTYRSWPFRLLTRARR